MAKRRHQLDTRVLTVFLLVALPFVAFGAFVVISLARGSLQHTIGLSLEGRAVQAKLLLERYVWDHVFHLRLLALDPEVRGALAQPPRDAGESRRLEQAWASGGADDVLAPVLASPLAGRLREVVAGRRDLKLLQVVDTQGRVIASSARGGRLSYTPAPWLHTVASQGQPHVGDVHRSPGGGSPLLDVAYPVRHPDDARWVGALRALVDGGDLYNVLNPVTLARTEHTGLIRAEDGLILASDEDGRVLRDRFPGFQSLQAAMQLRRGHWTLPEIRQAAGDGAPGVLEPERIVGFSAVDQIPGVDWLVAVEQDLAEATAPIQGVTRYLWIHFVGVFLTLTVLAVYLSFKLEAPVIEDELHLHEEHVPSGVRPQPH